MINQGLKQATVETSHHKYGRGRSLVFLALPLALAAAAFGCGERVKPGTVTVSRPAVSGVEVGVAKPEMVNEMYETSGTVRPRTSSMVASRVMGTVTALGVKEGDRVAAGQVLMTTDDREAAQKVAAAEAGLREAMKAMEAARQQKALAESTYGRYKKLHEGKALSLQELDQVETQKKIAELEYERFQEMVQRAKAGLAEAQVYHGFTRVTAPVSGVVTNKRIDQGSMAVPGMPLLTIEETSSYRIEANLDEGLAGRLRPGMPVEVAIESIGWQATATISEIVPAVDPLSRTFLVKIAASGANLRSGLYAKVRVPAGQREAILLPKAAVVEKGQLTGVYTVDAKGLVTYRLVRVGKQYPKGVEVLSGISAGDRIILAGVEKAIDGGVLREGTAQ